MKINQKGFTVVEIVLVVLLIGVIAFGSYFVWSKNSSKSAKNSQTNGSTNESQLSNETEHQTEASEVETVDISTTSFSVSLPENWNYRKCSDHSGLAALVPGGDGDMKCINSDAQWLETDIVSRGKVAIGAGSNPYPRQDWSSGTQKDLYDSDAKEVTLTNGKKAKKFTYKMEESKGKYFNVTEYAVDDVTVFVFDGHSAEEGYINDLTTAEVISLVESIVLPSIK